jgi:hypothetical protein
VGIGGQRRSGIGRRNYPEIAAKEPKGAIDPAAGRGSGACFPADIATARSMSQMYGISKSEAVEEARAVARFVDGWKEHFAACGVTRGDIDLYAEQLDRPFLRDQRGELSTNANPNVR